MEQARVLQDFPCNPTTFTYTIDQHNYKVIIMKIVGQLTNNQNQTQHYAFKPSSMATDSNWRQHLFGAKGTTFGKIIAK